MSKPIAVFLVLVSLVLAGSAYAQEGGLKPIKLPAPDREGGMPLMKALSLRSTSREFSPRKLPDQVLSDLLWAAFGINRADSGKRTAPTAMNRQEIDIYAATADGLYLYDAKKHMLVPVKEGDIRALTGRQEFAASAPLNLIFVADYSKMADRGGDEMRRFYSAADTGYISQNVYLYCASAGLSTVVRAMVDRDALSAAMGLSAKQKIVLAQTVGFPPE